VVLELTKRLGRIHDALELIGGQPRDEPLALSIAEARNLLPTDIVHLCLVLELAQQWGFHMVSLEAPPPSRLGVYLWRIGFWDLFPALAPRRPIREPGRGSTDRFIELTRFEDLAGADALGERLPRVLGAAPAAGEVAGGQRAFKRLASTVFEIAENTVAHSRRLTPDAPVVGYYMAQRMPNRRLTFLALGDIGDGIPSTMRAGFPDLVDDLAALQYALEPGVSASGGGGNGLYVARQAAHDLPGGVMSVESGAAFLRVRHDGSDVAERFETPRPITRVSFRFTL
jgi:hypothetical protein